MVNLLQQLVKFCIYFLISSWPRRFFVLLSISIIAIVFLLVVLYKTNESGIDFKSKEIQCRYKIESKNKEITELTRSCNVLGVVIRPTNDPYKNIDDFKRDWDTSDFYLEGIDTFCPKNRGKYNFQRMYYKYDSPLTVSSLMLKFQMVDEPSEGYDYTQRIVVGIKQNVNALSELDIPTRADGGGSVVNFRVASDSGVLVSGGEGKSLSSPIKEGSVINLSFRTNPKHGSEITEIIELNYISSVTKYGEENKSISYDMRVDDPQPETARAHIFLGSYIGGCIKIIDWDAN